MIQVRRSTSRGKTVLPWLDSRHSFSFGGYHDAAHMSFGALRVLNDDTIAPGAGFGMHEHQHMEIVTIVLDGSLVHEDSLGNSGVIAAGEVQRMSAGSGIKHSEMNASQTEPVQLLQLWITPKTRLAEPSYYQKTVEVRQNALTPIVSPAESDDVLTLNQDARLFIGQFEAGKDALYTFTQYRHGAYLFVIEGSVSVDGEKLHVRDAAAVSGAPSVKIEFLEDSKILLIDVPL
jgi:quercetin 2,3-dioxygenase